MGIFKEVKNDRVVAARGSHIGLCLCACLNFVVFLRNMFYIGPINVYIFLRIGLRSVMAWSY